MTAVGCAAKLAEQLELLASFVEIRSAHACSGLRCAVCRPHTILATLRAEAIVADDLPRGHMLAEQLRFCAEEIEDRTYAHACGGLGCQVCLPIGYAAFLRGCVEDAAALAAPILRLVRRPNDEEPPTLLLDPRVGAAQAIAAIRSLKPGSFPPRPREPEGEPRR